MIENIAILIPIHPPRYHFMYNLLTKLKNENISIDIYLVFSNETDYHMFHMKNEIRPIVISNPFISNSIVTFKKFYGLKELANSKYDYIICCDSEIDIIPKNFTSENINQKIKEIFHNKNIYAGDCSGIWVTNLIKEAAAFFPDKYEALKELTNNFTLYFWWSDLPVYRRTDINPFLTMIQQDKICEFDYLIYQCYLMLVHDFKIINTTPITKLQWSFENLFTNNTDILNNLIRIKYGFSWVNKNFYSINKDFIEAQKGFLVYHLDR